jgi:hypothetical protein
LSLLHTIIMLFFSWSMICFKFTVKWSQETGTFHNNCALKLSIESTMKPIFNFCRKRRSVKLQLQADTVTTFKIKTEFHILRRFEQNDVKICIHQQKLLPTFLNFLSRIEVQCYQTHFLIKQLSFSVCNESLIRNNYKTHERSCFASIFCWKT